MKALKDISLIVLFLTFSLGQGFEAPSSESKNKSYIQVKGKTRTTSPNVQVEDIMNRLYAATEKAYEDVKIN